MKTGTDTVALDHNPIMADTTAKVAMIIDDSLKLQYSLQLQK